MANGDSALLSAFQAAEWKRGEEGKTSLYWFARAAITKYHNMPQKCIYRLIVLEAKSWKSRCQQGWFLLKAIKKNLFHILPPFCWKFAGNLYCPLPLDVSLHLNRCRCILIDLM